MCGIRIEVNSVIENQILIKSNRRDNSVIEDRLFIEIDFNI